MSAVNDTVGSGISTITVTDWVALPPSPRHISVNVLSLVISFRVSLPVVGLSPDHVPLAVQAVVFALLHDNVTSLLRATDVALAAIETVGSGMTGGCTVTVVETVALPPGPVQVTVYVLVADNEPVLWVPKLASILDQLPEPLHDVASVLDHVSTLDSP